MSSSDFQVCVLCENDNVRYFFSDVTGRIRTIKRDFYHCPECGLVFVHPDQRLNPDDEFKRYEQHENEPEDPGYRKFLSRLFVPMNEKLAPGSFGLDFGSGPGPTLHLMFEEEGHKMEIYDPFYADDPSVFNKEYDFITTSETAEHLYRPMEEFERLWDCLKPGGWLGIMTKRLENFGEFRNWHYKNDDTHVIFFADETFEWLAKKWDTDPEFHGNDVVLIQKPS